MPASTKKTIFLIDCSALHRASNFNFFRVRFCVDGMIEAQQQVWVWWMTDTTRDGVDHKKNASRKEGKGIERSKLREGPEPRTVCTTYI